MTLEIWTILAFAAGFAGLIAVFLGLTVAEDALKHFWPKMREARRDRVISLTVMFGILLVMVGLAAGIQTTGARMQCDDKDPAILCN